MIKAVFYKQSGNQVLIHTDLLAVGVPNRSNTPMVEAIRFFRFLQNLLRASNLFLSKAATKCPKQRKQMPDCRFLAKNYKDNDFFSSTLECFESQY